MSGKLGFLVSEPTDRPASPSPELGLQAFIAILGFGRCELWGPEPCHHTFKANHFTEQPPPQVPSLSFSRRWSHWVGASLMTYLSFNHCFKDSKAWLHSSRGHLHTSVYSKTQRTSSCNVCIFLESTFFLFKGVYRVSIKYNEENTCFEKFFLIFKWLLIFFKDVFPLS